MTFTKKLKDEFATNQLIINGKISKYTSFKIGGVADVILDVQTIEDVKLAIEICKQYNQKYLIIGKGSNLLFSDAGFSGLLIHLGTGFSKLEVDGNYIVAQAGSSLRRLSELALKNSLKGLEFAHGIPGSVGGGTFMNAGAYGGEMKDVVEEIKVLNTNMEVEILTREDFEFGHRTSTMQKRQDIVLEVKFSLKQGKFEVIKDYMQDLQQRRVSKQPLEYSSAGSVFKRPKGYYASKLIQDSNLKGYCIGDACVSEKHSGFIINVGNAKSDDVIRLIEHVKKTVFNNYGVTLERELRIVDSSGKMY